MVRSSAVQIFLHALLGNFCTFHAHCGYVLALYIVAAACLWRLFSRLTDILRMSLTMALDPLLHAPVRRHVLRMIGISVSKLINRADFLPQKQRQHEPMRPTAPECYLHFPVTIGPPAPVTHVILGGFTAWSTNLL
jgi:hypothetical protein